MTATHCPVNLSVAERKLNLSNELPLGRDDSKPKKSPNLQPRIVMETSFKKQEDSFEGQTPEPVAPSLYSQVLITVYLCLLNIIFQFLIKAQYSVFQYKCTFK